MKNFSSTLLFQDLKDCNFILEVRDARLPLTTRVNLLKARFHNKARAVFFTKGDLVNEGYRQKILAWARAEGLYAAVVNTADRTSLRRHILAAAKFTEGQRRSLLGVLRVGVIGFPNVGKSSLINAFRGKSVARVANQPGITRGRQWIRVTETLMLLDTPGIATLAQKQARDSDTACKLGLCRIIADSEIELEDMVLFLLQKISSQDWAVNQLTRELGLNTLEFSTVLAKIAERRGFLVEGGQVDFLRASRAFLELCAGQILPGLELDNLSSGEKS